MTAVETLSKDENISRNMEEKQVEPPRSPEDKSRSFRKRRLTLATKCVDGAAAAAAVKAAAAAAAAAAVSSDADEPDAKKLKGEIKQLEPRIVHAGELMRRFSESSAPDHLLYRGPVAPVVPPNRNEAEWQERHIRHHHADESTLPFPRHVVGTWSAHGMEPVQEDYDVIEDDDEDDDWLPAGAPAPAKEEKEDKVATVQQQEEEEGQDKLVAKINQDRAGITFPYGNCARTAFFAAYDGHGQGGEHVSQFALHEIPKRLEKHPDFETNVEKAFKEVFVQVDAALTEEPQIEPLYAGTTACVALLRNNTLTLANAGDSRAVLATKTSEKKWKAQDLTLDQNPDVPQEQARIEEAGGHVSAPPEKGLSARVWLDCECSMIGLAMSRSIGDHAVKSVGVIAEPVVTTHSVERQDDFVILATDGVWEFISSQEAVDIVSSRLHEGSTKACQHLIEAAAAKWHDEEGDYRDDITAVVVRLQELWS